MEPRWHGSHSPGQPDDDPKLRDVALRPRRLTEVIGQKSVVERLNIVLDACKKMKEPLSHISSTARLTRQDDVCHGAANELARRFR